VILAQAAAARPDLIALGTHGDRGRFERWAMGSTAERVMSLASAPVLTVSSQAPPPPARLREVLCAVHLDLPSETLRFAMELAEHLDSGLTLLHVVECAPGQAPAARQLDTARARLLEAAAAVNPRLRPRLLVSGGQPMREIVRAASGHPSDLVVVGRQRPAADSHYCPGVVERVVRELGCAAITVPAAAERRFAVA
jgi:nucleotide-binding universal stress UspA family protein